MGYYYYAYKVTYFLFVFFQQLVVFFQSLKPRFLFWGASKHDISYVQAHISHLNKVPEHIAIVTDELFVNQIANIICWCFASNIHHTTIFDIQGGLKQKILLLQKMTLASSTSLSLGNIILHWHVEGNVRTMHINACNNNNNNTNDNDNNNNNNKSTTNIDNSQQEFNVYILSASDGRMALSSTAFGICESILLSPQNIKSPAAASSSPSNNNLLSSPLNNKSLPSIDQSTVGALLTDHFKNITEPDLILHFDNFLVMSGLAPWFIRLSEILFMGQLQDFTLQSFISSLYSYSKTIKKHGV